MFFKERLKYRIHLVSGGSITLKNVKEFKIHVQDQTLSAYTVTFHEPRNNTLCYLRPCNIVCIEQL